MLPAENGTIRRTICSGYLEASWAGAGVAAAQQVTSAMQKPLSRRMLCLPYLSVLCVAERAYPQEAQSTSKWSARHSTIAQRASIAGHGLLPNS
jgi:hypothetical protein